MKRIKAIRCRNRSRISIRKSKNKNIISYRNRSKKIKCSRNTVRIEAGIRIETGFRIETGIRIEAGTGEEFGAGAGAEQGENLTTGSAKTTSCLHSQQLQNRHRGRILNDYADTMFA